MKKPLLFALLMIGTVRGVAAQQPSKRAPEPSSLLVARQLAKEDFKGFTYGSWDKAKKTIDCTVFIDRVVKEMARLRGAGTLKDYEKKFSRVLKIAHLSDRQKNDLNKLVAAGDEEIRGVQTALVQAGLGVAVAWKDARPGDFVQYWYKTEKQEWHGHASIIVSIDKKSGKAVLYGSHKTSLVERGDGAKTSVKHGGVGLSKPVDLSDKSKQVYLVRWQSAGKPVVK